MDYDRMKSAIIAFAVGAAFVLWTAGAFSIGRRSAPKALNPAVTEKTDTLVVRDTITVQNPVYLTKYVDRVELVPVTDTLRIRDTLYIAQEREVREYAGEDYHATVSGIRPSLDEISVFPKTVTQTITQTVQVSGPQKWHRIGWGVAAGPGVFWQPGMDNVTPGVGILVGLRINL